MKKLLMVLTIGTFAACGGSSTDTTTDSTAIDTSTMVTPAPSTMDTSSSTMGSDTSKMMGSDTSKMKDTTK